MGTGTKIFLGVVAVGAVGGFIYESKLFKEQLKYTLSDIQIDWDKTKEANFQYFFVKIEIRIFNPVQFPVPFVRFHGKISINNVQVGSAISKSFTLPGNATATMEIPLALSSGNFVAQIISLFNSESSHIVEIDGSINSLFGKVPVTLKKKLEL